MKLLSGLVAAPYTPMREDGSVHLDVIDGLADRLAADGCTAAFVCGTTGEFASMTTQERTLVGERWCRAAPKGFHVVHHVGGTSLTDCQDLARHAQATGAAAIGVIAPYFFKPSTVEQLADFCAQIATAAPDLPFYYYHLPALTGVNLPMSEFLRVGSQKIPTLAGIKYSDTNLFELTKCLMFEDGRFNILFGCDEILLAGMSLGCDGAVGSTYSFAAPLYTKVLEALASGDIASARTHQRKSVAMIELLVQLGGHRAIKATMKVSGLDCGPVRPPQIPLSSEEYTLLEAQLAALGFHEFRQRLTAQ